MIFTPRYTYHSLSELAVVLGCAPSALYYYLERVGRYHWRLKPLNEAVYADWHRRNMTGELPPPAAILRAGVPVYDESGALIAESVSDAARRLGVKSQAMHYHLRPYRDGHQLISRPNPANTGRRGGKRLRRALCR